MVLYLGCGGSYTHLHMGHDGGELCTHSTPVSSVEERAQEPSTFATSY